MKDMTLFTMALGLASPWYVRDYSLDIKQHEMKIYIDFKKGGVFQCPCCGKNCKAYDSSEKVWRHLNFFENTTYLYARVPRIECESCGIKQASTPWARKGSGFTLMMEAFVMALVKEMPVNAVARLLKEYDTRIWRILNYYVNEAVDKQDLSNVQCIGIDETSTKKGHKYVSIFVDLAKSQVVHVTEGKGASTVKDFATILECKNGHADNIKTACCDMSPAFISGIGKHLKNAEITFDKFHIMKLVNKAVDQVRREESITNDLLKNTRYLWLKNTLSNSNELTRKELSLSKYHLKTARAWQIKTAFQDIFKLANKGNAELLLNKWYWWATHSRIEPIKKVAYSIKKHWNGILNWFSSNVSNGILEGINSLVQAVKAKARGYRNVVNFKTMIYLTAGKLKFSLPT